MDKLTCSDVRAIHRERRREAFAVGVHVAVFVVGAGVVVARVVSVGDTAVTGRHHYGCALQGQFQPLVALALLVEARKRGLDLAVGNRDDVRLGCTAALERARVRVAFVRVWVGLVGVSARYGSNHGANGDSQGQCTADHHPDTCSKKHRVHRGRYQRCRC